MASEQQDGQRANPELEQTADQSLSDRKKAQRKTRKDPRRASGTSGEARRRVDASQTGKLDAGEHKRRRAPQRKARRAGKSSAEQGARPKSRLPHAEVNASKARAQRKPQGSSAKRGSGRRRRRRTIPLSVLVVSVLVLVLGVVGIVRSVRARAGESSSEAQAPDRVELAATEGYVSFCAVGDNLMNGEGDYTVDLLGMADAWSGETGDLEYDFSPLYKNIKKKVSSYDIAFISQETTLGGHDGFDYTGYPTYNTPDSLATAVAGAGFDVVNCNTNHTWDTWENSIKHSQGVWAAQEGVTVVGSYASQKDRENIRVLDRNGIKIAFLSYCYGQNGLEQDDLPNDYYAAAFDKDTMRKEIAQAKELADAVVVYMHWGVENDHGLSEEQLDYASFLAGCGVDLTIGSHAHVIQPVQYVARGIRTTDGSGADASNGMLCVYGLGDFVSGYTLPKAILSGMFTCDFVRGADGEVTIQNPEWHGVVEHCENGEDSVYLLEDYTQELAEANQLLARVGENEEYTTTDPLEWARQTTRDVVGDAIPIVL